MPLRYPGEWKFGDFEYSMPAEAHWEFERLVSTIAERTEQKTQAKKSGKR